MKLFKYLFAICSVFLFSSCLIRTIYPLFKDNEIYIEPKIIGKWMNNDSSEIWEFENFGKDDSIRYMKKYKLSLIEIHKSRKNDTTQFEAMLGKIGSNVFLDLALDLKQMYESYPINGVQFYYMIFTHSYYKVIFKNDSLSLIQMDDNWVSKNIKKFKNYIIPRDNNDIITIILRTKELQKFIKKYANNKKAFPEREYLHRID